MSLLPLSNFFKCRCPIHSLRLSNPQFRVPAFNPSLVEAIQSFYMHVQSFSCGCPILYTCVQSLSCTVLASHTLLPRSPARPEISSGWHELFKFQFPWPPPDSPQGRIFVCNDRSNSHAVIFCRTLQISSLVCGLSLLRFISFAS